MSSFKYKRLLLAKEQLEVALFLFLDRESYASAITLAGAAEEVFGKALNARGFNNVMDKNREATELVHGFLSDKLFDNKSFFSRKNAARDSLKHYQGSDEFEVDVDLEEAACWLLSRALENGRLLGFEFAGADAFDEWFCQNIIGVLD